MEIFCLYSDREVINYKNSSFTFSLTSFFLPFKYSFVEKVSNASKLGKSVLSNEYEIRQHNFKFYSFASLTFGNERKFLLK